MSNLTADVVDANWLTEKLQANGFDVVVTGFNTTQIGTGQIGKCYRYDMQFDRDDSGAPASIVGKFASDDETSRATGVMLRNYYREVRFYQHLADKLTVRTPKCYYADIEGEGPDFILLLEDLSPAEQGDQLGGCDPATAASAIRELVGLQAPSWCDASMKAFDWLQEPADSPIGSLQDLYAQLLPGFVDRYKHGLDQDQIDILTKVGQSPNCPLFEPVGDVFCLEHVDYRLDNLLIDRRGDVPVVTVVDWQSVKVGKPLSDVAYFLGAGLLPPVRREAEEDILKMYHGLLQDNGITDFDWPACWEAYRRSTFAGFAVTVVASMIVGQTERGDQMFLAMADRHSRHALDLGAGEFLS